MTSGDLSTTIIIGMIIAAYAAVKITRIITGNWDNQA